ncbi:type II secretion system F family protein [Pseudovibrio sp. SPO723]|uniref:type II secretion system F family protein n=1 Tax=Nesiotobacter zosterae TaxID=392721 RepID=UPI0029C14F46|nr:type II secretion system F family protein [Pseudovibrio sp. SPO723]MDX5592376.1 type II secretion system F family protein [Pseudovibrio sp. SPO723]
MADLLAQPAVFGFTIALLVTLAVGGVLYVVLLPLFGSEKRKEQRLKSVMSTDGRSAVAAQAKVEGAQRRKSIQDQLKVHEEKLQQKKKNANKPAFSDWMAQAGLSLSKKKFYIYSIVFGLGLSAFTYMLGQSLLVVLALGFIGTFGMPRWYIGFLRKRRLRMFLDEFPNAVDVIVRGVKAGLPLGDCIRLVAAEGQEPVKTEFGRMVDAQQLGVPISEAVHGLAKRVPVAEANFFAIVITIQSQAGGGLSEALGNLSKVLRERKALKGKIKTMSAEAKSSAAIIGSLPLFVSGAIFLLSPDYIKILFNTFAGNVILAGSLFWMLVGVLVMRNMINFEA